MIVDRDPLSGLLSLRPSPLVTGLHSEQRKALRIKGRFRAVIAPRRAGKSYLFAVWLLGGKPGQVTLYCARTLKSAKAIMLPVFAELNYRYRLGLTIRTVEGEIIEPNGHIIRFHGLKDRAAAELLRGQEFRRAVIDECGAFDSELLEFSAQVVIQPTLLRTRGEMLMGGTPGPIPKGFFYDVVGDPLGSGAVGKWPSHAWTLEQNPHIPDVAEAIAEILKTNGWTIDHPRAQRELFGRWANDAGALIYRYQGERWAKAPASGKTVLVVDFAGSDKPEADDTAFIVGRQDRDTKPHVFLLEGFKKHGINISEIAALIRALKAKHNVTKVRVDAGALGAGYAKELREVYKIDCEGADKRDKRARISTVQAALDTKTLHVCEDSASILDEWLSLQWDEKHRDHHASCADDLSDALTYLLSEFVLVDPPSKVIDARTQSQRIEEELFREAQRGSSGSGRSSRMSAEPLIWLPEEDWMRRAA